MLADIAFCGIIILTLLKLLSIAAGTGALTYLCYRIDRILKRLVRSIKPCQ